LDEDYIISNIEKVIDNYKKECRFVEYDDFENIFIYLFIYIYKRVLVRGDQKNFNKLSFIIHKVRSPLT
jgi:hypothetical protein